MQFIHVHCIANVTVTHSEFIFQYQVILTIDPLIKLHALDADGVGNCASASTCADTSAVYGLNQIFPGWNLLSACMYILAVTYTYFDLARDLVWVCIHY